MKTPLASKEGVGAPVVNITTRMIKAGCRVLRECSTDDDLELIAITVYEAMSREAD